MKLNYSSILAVLLVATLLPAQVFAAKGGKPPPEPVPIIAEDVVCDDAAGCVDASDIVNGAVTTNKLSPALQQQINNLDARLTALGDSTPNLGADCRPLNLVPGADLRNCILTAIEINSNVDLTGANLSGADLRGASFLSVTLINADLTYSKLRDAQFNGSDLTGATLENADIGCKERACWGGGIARADFRNTILTNANLRNTNLDSVDFGGANLQGADLTNANISRAQMGADLYQAIVTNVIAFRTVWQSATCPNGIVIGNTGSCLPSY